MGESAENRSWDEVLAESLRNKLRSEGMRTDFMKLSASAPIPQSAPPRATTERSAPAPAQLSAPSPPPGPFASVPEPTPPGPAGPERAAPLSAPAGGATSAEMVVDQLRRSLGPSDEKRALDILRGRGGARGAGALIAAGALAVLVSATTAFVLGRRPDGGGLRLAPALEPPREAPLPGPPRAVGDQSGIAARDLQARTPARHEPGGDTVPVFRLGRAAPETEWVDLGGPLVDLDRSPPRTNAGP